jgi:hypothetical protein
MSVDLAISDVGYGYAVDKEPFLGLEGEVNLAASALGCEALSSRVDLGFTEYALAVSALGYGFGAGTPTLWLLPALLSPSDIGYGFGMDQPSLSPGPLPEGLQLTDNGDGTADLYGTPAAGTAGRYEIQLEADNDVEPNATQTLILTVQD